MIKPLHVLSLGAGVQSSTLALMAAAGEVAPMPAAAIFADTQAEPKAVYLWLDWLEKQLPFPVHRVSKGDLGDAASRLHISKNGIPYAKAAVPAFIVDSEKRVGLLMRQCTSDFKIEPIQRELRRLVGKKGTAVQWMGISLDEAHRMRDSRKAWITNRYPLIEARISCAGCLDWMKARGHPKPPRSACVFCPYHSNAEWSRLKRETPDEFAKAVAFEETFKIAVKGSRLRGEAFLHRSLVPLKDVEFDKSKAQGDLFGNECEGMCGV